MPTMCSSAWSNIVQKGLKKKIDAMQKQIDIFVKAEKERHEIKNEDIKL